MTEIMPAEGSPAASIESFVAQPYVCGVLGPDGAHLFQKLKDAAPGPVRQLHASPQAGFAASPCPGLKRVKDGWVWGRYVASKRLPQSATDAAESLGLSGFWHSEETTIVHVDGTGFQDLYTRVIGDTTYFSNRIGPLSELPGAQLHTDSRAWGRCFVLSAFVDTDTPFVEIRRLPPGGRLRRAHGATHTTAQLPSWLTNPVLSASLDDLSDALLDSVPHRLFRSTDITLSGGYDSRLLLAVIRRRRGGRVATWTTPHESGGDGDHKLAERTAAVANVPWHLIDYDPDQWARLRSKVLARLEYSSVLHTWLMPLADSLRTRHSALLDGLAGDVLMRYHSPSPPKWADHAAHILNTLGAGVLKSTRIRQVLQPDTVDKWSADLETWWRDRMLEWQEHPFGESVLRLLSRTNRCIAASPFRLFGPECQVLTPFIDPSVMRVVLSVPPLPKDDRDLRPHLLNRFDRRLAAIPSANDLHSNQVFTEKGPRHPPAVAQMAGAIGAEPTVSALFTAQFLDGIMAGRQLDPQDALILRKGAMLAEWLAHSRHLLADADASLT